MTSNVLAPAAPLIWSDLERRLADAAARGLVPKDSVPGLRGTLRSALLGLVQQRNRLTETSAADVFETVDLTAYLPHAAEAAKLRAKAVGHVRPGNAAARVSQALRLALPETFGGEALTSKQKAALRGPSWQPLFAAVESLPHGGVHHRYLVILADAVWGEGGDGPSHLPPTADRGAELLRRAGRNETEVAKAVHAYRKAREALAADGLLIPDAPTWKEPRTGRLGVRRIGGAAGDPEETLKRELPAFYDLLQEWRSGPADALRPHTRRSSEGALFRVAGLLAQMHAAGALPVAALLDVHPLHLWQIRVRSPRQDASALPTDIARVARLLTPLVGADGAVATARTAAELPLAAAAGEWAVIHKVVKRRTAKGSKFSVSEGLVYDFGRVWQMVRGVAEPLIRTAENKEQLEQFELLAGVVAAVEQHFAKLHEAAGEPTVKDKVRAIEHCTLPIMTCLVLPWWTMVELPRRRAAVAEYAASRGAVTERRSKYDRRTERALGNRYETALESWALQAVVTADPLRRAQAVYGRLGREYALEAEWNADGSLSRVLRVGSRFHGQGWEDNPAASLKQDHLGLREWQLSPSVLALEWFAEYLERVWLARLRRRGLIDSEASLREAVESGRFSLFVSGDTAGSNPT